jgi:hypothetical protein
MAVHAYLSMKADSPVSFGDALESALRRHGEVPSHVSGEAQADGWLVRFHSSAKDAKAGSKATASYLVIIKGGVSIVRKAE